MTNRQQHIEAGALASWCNKRQLFWAVDFGDFQPRKGFTCNYYLTNNQQ